jgi:hypothetical protein
MKLYTDEWREAQRIIHDVLKEQHQNSDMGSSRYEKANTGRFVTVKHRMRKDKVSVVTLGCWNWENPEGKPLTNEEARERFSASGMNVPQSKKMSIKTTALLDNEHAELIGQTLLAYLNHGEKPQAILDMPTYPSYEDLDKTS